MLREVVILLSVVTLVKCHQRCWQCSNEGNLAVCRNNTVTCPASEHCFVEKVVTNLDEVFNAGCRSNTACLLMYSLSAAVIGKRSTALCGQCCTGPHCQDTLCGLTPSTLTCNQRCWQCSNEGNLAVCRNNTVTCPANEHCFVEKVVTNSDEVVFNAGCRSNTACVIMQSLSSGTAGKRSRSLCGKCCTGLHCQDTLCGLNPGGPSQLRCLSCSSVTSPADCLVYETCQDRKVCYAGIHIEYSSLRYSFGCQEKHLCQNSAANDVAGHPGREIVNGVSICDACCASDYCNNIDCYILKKNMI